MSSGLYSHTTRGSGTILTAAIYNADHVNHITNQNPSATGGYSDDVAQMQLSVDPGGVGSESLAASLAGEIERIRFALARIHGGVGAQWYEAPAASLEDVAAGGIADDSVTNAKLANMAGDTLKGRIGTTGDPQDVGIGTTLQMGGGLIDVALNGITTARLAEDAVTAGKIADGAVTTTRLADLAVTNNKVAFGIDGDKILNNSISQLELASDSVGTAQIINGNVTSAKLASGVLGEATTYVDFTGGSINATAFNNVFPGSVVQLNAFDSTQTVNLNDTAASQFSNGAAFLVYANQSGTKRIRAIESQTIVSVVGGTPNISAQRGVATVMKIPGNFWVVGGNIS